MIKRVYICIYIYVYVYTYPQIHMHMHVHIHIHIHMSIHSYKYAYVHIYIYIRYIYVHIHVHTYREERITQDPPAASYFCSQEQPTHPVPTSSSLPHLLGNTLRLPWHTRAPLPQPLKIIQMGPRSTFPIFSCLSSGNASI